jgi:hypothetical protein
MASANKATVVTFQKIKLRQRQGMVLFSSAWSHCSNSTWTDWGQIRIKIPAILAWKTDANSSAYRRRVHISHASTFDYLNSKWRIVARDIYHLTPWQSRSINVLQPASFKLIHPKMQSLIEFPMTGDTDSHYNVRDQLQWVPDSTNLCVKITCSIQ